MAKPVIGITADHHGNHTYHTPYVYCDAVAAAGGLPLILPFRTSTADVPQLVDLLNGIVFSGGNDLDPSAWGEPRHPRAQPIDPDRERFERALLAEVERRRLPTLGICLGSQLINVHRGGSLHQFIPDLPRNPDLEHRRIEGRDASHFVDVLPGSRLAEVLGTTTLRANSAHKQSVRTVGRGLRVVATAPDGIVEGLEDPELPFFLAVQWHPERIHSDPVQLRLFQALVRASGQRG
ncbi:MAG: gamma-glutamyl-gamma-aminobutyrate hydrolase family protein [Tepidisphaerales bacterium]